MASVQERCCTLQLLAARLVSEGQWSWEQGLTGPCVALVPLLMALQLEQPLLLPPPPPPLPWISFLFSIAA